ncbi:hypothetical protein HELRODRAFT_177469 [Helobdella robusta]|uniref:Uncharacterized protein n=1 Tax=Helobdella robusta TaxID=6412 RepID=T1FBR0_HELRO|nr:hypothetical protein HELRODRAFT_177469 [Helobdella robusta]ESN97834.1 hypothetical protein HELRODRAFT_177469 [Helobdella robusta]
MQIMEGANAKNIPIYITPIDFRIAFDSINRGMKKEGDARRAQKQLSAIKESDYAASSKLDCVSRLSVLLYGCESWTQTEAMEHKLDIFARKRYGIILHINQAEAHIINKELYNTTDKVPTSSQTPASVLNANCPWLLKPCLKQAALHLHNLMLRQSHQHSPRVFKFFK